MRAAEMSDSLASVLLSYVCVCVCVCVIGSHMCKVLCFQLQVYVMNGAVHTHIRTHIRTHTYACAHRSYSCSYLYCIYSIKPYHPCWAI